MSQSETTEPTRTEQASTQGQWTFEEHKLSERYACIIYDENGVGVADYLTRDQATLIVQAVNAHAALVEALRGCLTALDIVTVAALEDDAANSNALAAELKPVLTAARAEEAEAQLATCRGERNHYLRERNLFLRQRDDARGDRDRLCVRLEQASLAHQAAVAELAAKAVCPDCNGAGWYPDTAPNRHTGEPEQVQVQCERCYATPRNAQPDPAPDRRIKPAKPGADWVTEKPRSDYVQALDAAEADMRVTPDGEYCIQPPPLPQAWLYEREGCEPKLCRDRQTPDAPGWKETPLYPKVQP